MSVPAGTCFAPEWVTTSILATPSTEFVRACVFGAEEQPMQRRWSIAAFVMFLTVLAGGEAAAQALLGAIEGSLKDDSGALLPGATVEVSSPALIEGTRSTVTD